MPQHASATFTAARGPDALRERYCEAKSLLLRALKANASCIVSGDKHLLGLKRFKGVKIVTVDEMLETLSPRTAAS